MKSKLLPLKKKAEIFIIKKKKKKHPKESLQKEKERALTNILFQAVRLSTNPLVWNMGNKQPSNTFESLITFTYSPRVSTWQPWQVRTQKKSMINKRKERGREPLKEASNWSSDLSMSSEVRQFRSLQIHHIRHNGAKFQMLEECFPNQFHQLKRVSATDLDKTHEIPKDLKTKLHN